MSYCTPGNGRPPVTGRRPGSEGSSQTPPTGEPHDEGAKRGRTPPPPPGPSEQSERHKLGTETRTRKY